MVRAPTSPAIRESARIRRGYLVVQLVALTCHWSRTLGVWTQMAVPVSGMSVLLTLQQSAHVRSRVVAKLLKMLCPFLDHQLR